MPRLSAAPITLTTEEDQDLRWLSRAHKTPRKLAERATIIVLAAAGAGVREDGPPAWHLAENGASVARPLAIQPGRDIDRGAAGGRAAARRTCDVHA